MQPTVLTALKKASKGLLYPSDSDEPFEPVAWGKADGDLTPDKVLKLAGAPAGTKVEEVKADDFFKNLTSDEIDDADKYKNLQKVVNDQLSGVRVFRVGKIKIDVYLVGQTKDGEWGGLKTRSVET
jgi:hypothetical protein